MLTMVIMTILMLMMLIMFGRLAAATPPLANKRNLHIYVLFEGLFSERAFPPPPPREQNHRTYICMSGERGLF